MAQKKALTDITGSRYRKAGKAKKTLILDEFCQTIGYNRKYAITLLKGQIPIRVFWRWDDKKLGFWQTAKWNSSPGGFRWRFVPPGNLFCGLQ
jgi:hypothetical protein